MNTIAVEQQGKDEVKLEHNDKRQENCLDLNEYLPENCIFDILARLPIETLCSSRFVCKSWYAIINRPDFKNAHLQQSDTTTTTGLLFSTMAGHSSIEIKFMEIKDGKSTKKEYNNTNFIGKILATCNGLVVLEHFDAKAGSIILLNPVTREQEDLPSGTIILTTLGHSYGLAFCHMSTRYKLLHLFCMGDDGLGCEILDIGSRTWRVVDVPAAEKRDFHLSNDKVPIIFAMGALHWIQFVVGRGECMVSMPLDDEKFRTMAFPAAGGNDQKHHSKSVFAMGREFVGFASQQQNANNCQIGVWVLRGFGGEWEKQYDVDIGSRLRMRRLLYCGGVKCNDQLVLTCVSYLYLSFYAYDRHSQLVRQIASSDIRMYFPHVNSLVSWRS